MAYCTTRCPRSRLHCGSASVQYTASEINRGVLSIATAAYIFLVAAPTVGVDLDLVSDRYAVSAKFTFSVLTGRD